MHVEHLYKIQTTDLKPAYYFKFDMPTGSLSMKVLEFGANGRISKLSIFPYTYFNRDNGGNIRNSFVTKRKYYLFVKKLKSYSKGLNF